MQPTKEHDILISLPAAMSRSFSEAYPDRAEQMFVASDPEGRQLGSGGGTVNLLLEAFRAQDKEETFLDWLELSPKMIIHGSGESRRLQAYASEGKPMMPLPALPLSRSTHPLPTLLDLQVESYSRIARLAPEEYCLMVTCGDVYLSFSDIVPAFPEADILFVGMRAAPEEAQNHGVMITSAQDMSFLMRFLQKPSVAELEALTSQETYLLDTGVWLFSKNAVSVLLKKCGIDVSDLTKSDKANPSGYDMFSNFGPALGQNPTSKDAEVSKLTGAVLPLPESKFYHFGSSRSILASTQALLKPAEEKRSFANASLDSFGSPVVIGHEATCKFAESSRHIWIENSHIGEGWSLSSNHIITGVPANNWTIALEEGSCLTMLPVPDGQVLKFYGFDDSFRGAIDEGVSLLGDDLSTWLSVRDLDSGDLGMSADTDIYELPLFPVLDDFDDGGFVEWLTAKSPAQSSDFRSKYISVKRLSARELLAESDVAELQMSRLRSFSDRLESISSSPEEWSHFCRSSDLSALARLSKEFSLTIPPAKEQNIAELAPHLALGRVHEAMLRDETGEVDHEEDAFSILRELIVREMEMSPVQPSLNVMEDQIVWGRSPLRLDLAGGWSDTPPFCLEHGGRVTNLSVDLNGQPPIQVFARINNRKDILLRSIDLGVSETIPSYENLLQPVALGSEFGIAKAALALCGFDPRFHINHTYRTLQQQLDAEFGGGIELSMVCAVPKGSGLGTSSILAATVLATLNELCGLSWSMKSISQRTMALEQLLTSGGGWQDQVGGVTRGVKLVTTPASLTQEPEISWLPGTFFQEGYANNRVLLYYTGITRVAHDILGEIVRNMFLNSAKHGSIIGDISYNAIYAAEACQKNNWGQLCESVRRSWRLNQLLDAGTNPPEVQYVVESIGPYIEACKLLGAGGGGYMVIFAKDDSAALKIRETLNASPPNTRSRFVDIKLSETGVQVTKS